MQGEKIMKGNSRLFRAFGVVSISLASLVTVATSSGASSSGSIAKGQPVLIGASLSITGDFSGDGQAFQQGYELWAADQNAKGGLLGHKIVLKILNDTSDPTQAVLHSRSL